MNDQPPPDYSAQTNTKRFVTETNTEMGNRIILEQIQAQLNEDIEMGRGSIQIALQ